jgi:hypothetical protein
MMQQIRFDNIKFEKVADKIFQERWVEVLCNDYSPICGMICITGNKLNASDIRSLEYYGFMITSIEFQEAGIIIWGYQNQDIEGHKL